MGEETAKPSYQRGMPRKLATIALSKAQLNIPPAPAVTNVKPAQPAPLREPRPTPLEAPQPAPVAQVAAPQQVQAGTGVIGWLRGLFAGAPAAPTAEPAKAESPAGRREDRGNRRDGRGNRDGRRDDRGNREESRRTPQGETRGNKPQVEPKQAQPQPQQQKPLRGDKQPQQPRQDKQQKPPQPPKPQGEKQSQPPRQERSQAAKPSQADVDAERVAMPGVATAAAAIAATPDTLVQDEAPMVLAAGSAERLNAGAPAAPDDTNGEAGSKRRRGRRGGRRRRRGAGDAAGVADDGTLDQDGAPDEALDADGAQPEFDFDDIAPAAPRTVAVNPPPSVPLPASAAVEASAHATVVHDVVVAAPAATVVASTREVAVDVTHVEAEVETPIRAEAVIVDTATPDPEIVASNPITGSNEVASDMVADALPPVDQATATAAVEVEPMTADMTDDVVVDAAPEVAGAAQGETAGDRPADAEATVEPAAVDAAAHATDADNSPADEAARRAEQLRDLFQTARHDAANAPLAQDDDTGEANRGA